MSAYPEDWLRPSWHDEALCARLDAADLFFAPDNEQRGPRQRRETDAKKVCAKCPVLVPCRADCEADESEGGDVHGVWAGETESERRARRRGVRLNRSNGHASLRWFSEENLSVQAESR